MHCRTGNCLFVARIPTGRQTVLSRRGYAPRQNNVGRNRGGTSRRHLSLSRYGGKKQNFCQLIPVFCIDITDNLPVLCYCSAPAAVATATSSTTITAATTTNVAISIGVVVVGHWIHDRKIASSTPVVALPGSLGQLSLPSLWGR